ncbi:MAG: hypothetical protein RQ839_10200, partial [Thermoproteus sp.]|nr:hypothetical protein [Thermoproteus sp.]
MNENSVAVARVSLLSTVDAVARWNRRYVDPAVYSIRTDFGRLAKRYEAVRGKKLEELRRRYPFAGRDGEERASPYELSEGRLLDAVPQLCSLYLLLYASFRLLLNADHPLLRVLAQILGYNHGGAPRHLASGLLYPALLPPPLTKSPHELSKLPCVRDVLREDKAAEGGSAVFYASSFRNSKACPI